MSSKRRRPKKSTSLNSGLSKIALAKLANKLQGVPKQQRRSITLAFIRRSQAAKKSWRTRRGIEKLSNRSRIPKSEGDAAVARIKQLEAELETTRQELLSELAETRKGLAKFVKEFEIPLTVSGMPPRNINETAEEHAIRIITIFLKQGMYGPEAASKQISDITGLSPREVYTLFHYIGAGDFVA